MARRDRAALALYRSAISAIDNAAAVPVGDEQWAGAIEVSPVGVGRTEVERRSLTSEEELDIVKRGVQDRRAAADSLAVSNPDAARRLRSDAATLESLLDGIPKGT